MDDERLTRHVAGLATDEEVREAERHLLLCRECRHALVATATRHRSAERRRRARRVAPFAAAAVLVLSIGTYLARSQGSPDGTVLRGAPVAGGFLAVAPVRDAGVSADAVVFTWTGAPGDAYYALTLTDAGGAVVWSTETADTAIALPAEVRLQAGARYYWFIDALLDGANSATTGVQEFQVR